MNGCTIDRTDGQTDERIGRQIDKQKTFEYLLLVVKQSCVAKMNTEKA